MTRQLRVAVLSGLFLLSFLAVVDSVRAQNAPSKKPIPPEPIMDQMTDIPYFTLRDGMNSTLTLNNVGPTSTPVTVTIYNLEGKAQMLKPITLAPHSFKQIELRDVVVGDEFDSGNLKVAYAGISMGVTCQVSVSNPDKRVSFESRDVWGQQDMQDMMGSMSKSMSGILWLPQESAEGFLAVTNVGKNKTTVQVSTGSRPQTVTLYSRETRLMKLSEESGQHGPAASLVKLQSDGLPGEVVTTGFVLDLKRGYSSAFTLFDSGLMRSSHLSGAHLRIGKPDQSEGFPDGTLFRSPLLLANIGPNPVKAHVSVDYTVRKKLAMSRWDDKGSSDSEGATEEKSSTVTVKDPTIAPGEVTRIELSEALEKLGIAQITEAGVDIDYDTPPGTLIGHLVSVDQSGDYSFEVPIKDPAGMMEMTDGIYPWSLEDGNNTVLHLKNTTNQAVNGLLLFDYYDKGIVKTYSYPEIVLEPYQTVAIDIQKLKDSKKPDVRGQLFPVDVTHGQAQWRQDTPYTMIGRAEQTNMKEGIARSFSCNYLCCTNYTETDYLLADPLTGPVGGSGSLVAWKLGQSCNGFAWGPSTDGAGQSWSSNASSIASVNGGLVSYVAAGSTYVNADLSETWYQSDFPCTCTRHHDYLGFTSVAVLAYTPIQHNYPRNPLPQICRIASFFDAVRNQKAHHAEDVVYDNGNGGSVRPPYGTPVSAMEAGTVVAAVSGNGPASQPYPQCAGTGAAGNYVKIKADADGYFTIYYHMTPSVSVNQHVTAGQQIGVLDTSGCQSGAHLHVGRKNPSNAPVNFTIPCVNPTPSSSFDDGTVGDDVPDNI